MQMREFTNQDYYGFAGAEKPSKFQEPLICFDTKEKIMIALICDKTNIQVHYMDETTGLDIGVLVLEVPFTFGKLICENLKSLVPSELVEAGFTVGQWDSKYNNQLVGGKESC